MSKPDNPEEIRPLAPAVRNAPRDLEDFIGTKWYATLVFSASFFVILSTVLNIVYMVYAGATPVMKGCGGEIFPDDQKIACARYHELRNGKSQCKPVLKYQFESVNIEYDYLCHDAMVVKKSTTFQMLAVLLGTFIFGQLSDIYGRRRMLLYAIAGMGVMSLAVANAYNFGIFYGFRLGACFFTGGTSAIHGVYIIEHSQKHHRMLISNIVTWSPNFALAPVIAYFAHDWRTFALYSFYVNILTFVLLWICSESPRFLIQKGKIHEARVTIARIRSINRDKCAVVGCEVEQMLETERERHLANEKKNKHYTYFDLFKAPDLRKYTLIIGFGVLVTSLQNYGILFNTEKLSGSLYVNGSFFGIIRWIANLIIGTLDLKFKWCTRKIVAAFSKLTNLICLITIIVIFQYDQEFNLATIVRVASIIVLVFCGPIFTSSFLTASELYPTSVRNVGTSFQSMSARVGTIFGTTIFILTEYHKAAAYWILALLLIVDTFVFQCFVPETKGSELTDHIAEKSKVETIDDEV